MDISLLDFILINIISFCSGTATGLLICCKYKDNILIKSRSRDNLSHITTTANNIPEAIVASAPPPPTVTKITLE